MDSRKNYFEHVDGLKYKLDDFLYDLPENLIAQYPLEKRDTCRLMVVHRDSGKIDHRHFHDILQYFHPNDCLVLNDTRVFPARLLGRKDKTGAQVEIFLLRNLEGKLWEVLVKPARKVRIGNKILFSDDLSCNIVDNTLSGGRVVEFSSNGNFFNALEKLGSTPLPPYIKRKPEILDKEYYQTVYANKPGAVAAPTAGLHFTQNLLKKLEVQGLKIVKITLHVGLGTFRPVQVEDITRHKMDSEYYEIEVEAAEVINLTRQQNGNIIAVGTTVVRALETVADPHGFIRPARGWTDKYIYPPYEFRVVDRLLTNFHLPGSTLLLLVSAFAGMNVIKDAYELAVNEEYRFFSYGDAMLIW